MARLLPAARTGTTVGTLAARPVRDYQPEPLKPALEPFDLREALAILRRRAWLLLFTTVAASAAAGYVELSDLPKFRTNAVIRLADTRAALTGALANSPSEGLGGAGFDPLLSQLQVLSSRALAGQVVDSVPALRLELRELPAVRLASLRVDPAAPADTLRFRFSGAGPVVTGSSGDRQGVYGAAIEVGGVQLMVPAAPAETSGRIVVRSRESSINQVLANLEVQPRDRTDVVDVWYTDHDPEVAQQVANAIVKVFQAANADAAQQQSRLRRVFVQEQLRQNDSLLLRAQLALSAFRGGTQLYSSKERLSAEQSALLGVEVQRQSLASDRGIYQSLLKTLEEGSGEEEALGALVSAPGAAANPVVAQLYTQLVGFKTARDSLLALGSARTHPDVERLATLIEAMQTKLVSAAHSLIRALDSRIQALDNLKVRTGEVFVQYSGKEAEEATLTQQMEGLRTISDQLRQEFQRARISEAVEVGQVEILDLAMVPGTSTGVGPTRKVLFGSLLGFLLGLGLAFVLEHMNSSIRRRDQIEPTLFVPGLAVIPQMSRSARRSVRALGKGRNNRTGPGTDAELSQALVAAVDLRSNDAEAYRQLRTSLLFSQSGRVLKTIVVTSPAPGDGKSTVASNLAVTFAQQGMRVLLVDCDLRRSSLHNIFRVRREPGLTQVLRGELALEAAMRVTGVDNLFLLSAGPLVAAPAELLGAPQMRALLDRLTHDFEVIILDSPPVLVASDAAVLAATADGTLVVLRAGQTEEGDAQLAVEQLTAVGAQVVGAVLNDPDAAARRHGGYQYAGYYGE